MRRRGALAVAALAALTLAAAPVPRHTVLVGRSVLGRPIDALVLGDPDAPSSALAIGCVHGDETAGEAVTRRLRGARPPRGVALWLIDAVNPDGCRAGTRGNAHGVDLNRNAPHDWRAVDPPGGTYYAGPHALSEPESRAVVRLVERLHPDLTIWYHQHAALVDASGGDARVERRYARLVGLPFEHFGDGLPGTFTGWQNATFRTATAFVVELPAGPLSPAATARHARAVLDAVRRLPPLARAAVG